MSDAQVEKKIMCQGRVCGDRRVEDGGRGEWGYRQRGAASQRTRGLMMRGFVPFKFVMFCVEEAKRCVKYTSTFFSRN